MIFSSICLSVGPSSIYGPTQGKRATLSRVGIEPHDPRIRSLLLHRLSYNARQGQAMGIKDLKSLQMITDFVPLNFLIEDFTFRASMSLRTFHIECYIALSMQLKQKQKFTVLAKFKEPIITQSRHVQQVASAGKHERLKQSFFAAKKIQGIWT